MHINMVQGSGVKRTIEQALHPLVPTPKPERHHIHVTLDIKKMS